MNKFRLASTKEAQEFCEGVVMEMIQLFNISEEEAWGRVNIFWKRPFSEDYDINFWANTMYFGPETNKKSYGLY